MAMVNCKIKPKNETSKLNNEGQAPGAHQRARSSPLSTEVTPRSSGLCRGGLSLQASPLFLVRCELRGDLPWLEIIIFKPCCGLLHRKKNTGCSKCSCRLVAGKAPGVDFFCIASGGHGQEQNRTS